MPVVDLIRQSRTPESFRAAKVMGMFDVPAAPTQEFRLHASVPIETDDWRIGVITGPSGSGKSTLAAELFGPTAGSYRWGAECLLDDFPAGASIDDIVGALTAVGLSSPPAWLRPYAVLSTGQQARAELARALLTESDLVVYDEFSSVVDRIVARAMAHSVRRWVDRVEGKRFVAVTCHRDVVPWLEPDWVFDTETGEFARGCLQRPEIEVAIRHGRREAWRAFRAHHYLTRALSPTARVFLAFVRFADEPDAEERLAGFFSILPSMGQRGWWRGHRTVILPDFQGLGIGNRMIEHVAEWLWTAERKRFRATTSAPAIIHHRRRHPEMWHLAQAPKMKAASGNREMHVRTSAGRLTTSWEFVPSALRPSAASPKASSST